MDLSELSLGEKLVGIGGIILFIAVFFPWYSVSVAGFGGNSVSLWSASQGIAILILIAVIVAIGIIALRMFQVLDISEQGVPEPIVVLAAAVVAAALAALRVLSIPGPDVGLFGAAAGVSVGRSWGLFVGIIGAALLIVGAVMKFQEERA